MPTALFKTLWTQNGTFGKLEVSDDLSEPRRNPDDKKMEFCGERSSKTLYKSNGERNSISLQLLKEILDVGTKNDRPVRKELNVVQRLSSKYKSILMGGTENIEHKGKTFSRRYVGNSLYLLMMMMDDSTTFQEEQNKCTKISENELVLTYLQRSQSTLMRKCVAEQILGNWLETFSTYLEIYPLDVEVIMEVQVNELKQLCTIPFKSSNKKQSNELNEIWALMMKYLITGKLATSNEKTVFGNILLCYVNLWKTSLWSTNWIMGWDVIAVEKEYNKQLANLTMNMDFSKRQRQLMANSKDK